MKKQWLITLVGLTMALAAITGGGFALASNGTAAPEVGEPSGDQPPIRSDEDIDPNECNWIHNIFACDDTLAIGPDEEGTIEPDFSEDGPYPVPDRDVVCDLDQGVAVIASGQVACLDLAPDNGDSQDMVSPGRPPIADAIQ